MGPANRQDVQNIVEVARNRIMERAVTKQDLSVLSDAIRNLTNLHMQSQQLLKQSEYQRLQLTRRAVALEARIASFENEIRSMQSAMYKMAEQRPQQIVMPAPAEQTEPTTQYAYRPE